MDSGKKYLVCRGFGARREFLHSVEISFDVGRPLFGWVQGMTLALHMDMQQALAVLNLMCSYHMPYYEIVPVSDGCSCLHSPDSR